VSGEPRMFTLEEANGLIPRLTLEFSRIARLREGVAKVARTLGGPDAAVALLEQRRDPLPGEGEHAERLRELADDIGRTVARIHELGCVVKDLEMGLVDFYGKHDGKTVFLCWQFGEAAVGHYHALDSGFESRQRLSSNGTDEPPLGLLN
jgi:hypothetical protein